MQNKTEKQQLEEKFSNLGIKSNSASVDKLIAESNYNYFNAPRTLELKSVLWIGETYFFFDANERFVGCGIAGDSPRWEYREAHNA